MPVTIRTNMPATPKAKLTPVMVDTPRAFRLVLDNAAHGQQIIYYTGDLAYDREAAHRPVPEREAICRVADAALAASDTEKVHLWQRRIGRAQFEYIATVRR